MTGGAGLSPGEGRRARVGPVAGLLGLGLGPVRGEKRGDRFGLGQKPGRGKEEDFGTFPEIA